MSKMRTEKEVAYLVELALAYCTLRSEYRCAKAEGRLSVDDDSAMQRTLAGMDKKIELLKSNNELDRRRARRRSNIVSLVHFKQRSAQ